MNNKLNRSLANPLTVATGMVSRAISEIKKGSSATALEALQKASVALEIACGLVQSMPAEVEEPHHLDGALKLVGAPSPEEDGVGETLSKHTVLIVDDESYIRDILRYEIEKEGAAVLEATNGNIAYAMLGKHRIDAVITDIRMPDGDGIELLDRIRAAHSHGHTAPGVAPRSRPVVLFITGHGDITNDQALGRGVDAVFSKPFDPKRVIGCIKNLLTRGK